MSLNIKAKDRKENNRSYIYRTLKDNIMNLNLKPGEPISEIELGKSFNVSRTPIREAFIKLSEEKLVDIFPQRGSFVSHIDLKVVREGIFMRKSLEKSVLLEATKEFPKEKLEELKKILAFQNALAEFDGSSPDFFKLDNQFHEVIFNGCGVGDIWKVIDNMNTHYNRLRFMDTVEQINTSKIVEQHQKIIDFIESKDSSGVPELIDIHLTNIMEEMDLIEEKFPNYFKKR